MAATEEIDQKIQGQSYSSRLNYLFGRSSLDEGVAAFHQRRCVKHEERTAHEVNYNTLEPSSSATNLNILREERARTRRYFFAKTYLFRRKYKYSIISYP